MSTISHKISRTIRRPRLLTASFLAITTCLTLQLWVPFTRSLLIAFDIGVLVYLLLMIHLFSNVTTASMRSRAEIQQDGKWTVLTVSLFVAIAVLAALSKDLHAAKTKSLIDITLASSTIVFSWMFVAVTFSQQYAHAFYTKSDQLQFPGTPHPDYWDFLYFSTVLSMCCQTSDVVVTEGKMRRLVLVHGVISFFFNVIIISITVNVVASGF
jgi:uncharacterized membrane protein